MHVWGLGVGERAGGPAAIGGGYCLAILDAVRIRPGPKAIEESLWKDLYAQLPRRPSLFVNQSGQRCAESQGQYSDWPSRLRRSPTSIVFASPRHQIVRGGTVFPCGATTTVSEYSLVDRDEFCGGAGAPCNRDCFPFRLDCCAPSRPSIAVAHGGAPCARLGCEGGSGAPGIPAFRDA